MLITVRAKGLKIAFYFSFQVRSHDYSLVDVIVQLPAGDTQEAYKIASVEQNTKSFKKVAVEFKSRTTGQRELLYVSYSAPYGGAMPVLLPGATQSNQQCPPSAAIQTERTFQAFVFALLGQTSAFIIGFSIFIGFLILALILCCSPRYRSGGPHPGMTGPGSRSATPYGSTPIQYHGSYSAGRGAYSGGSYSGYHTEDENLVRSVPEEHDETRREMRTTYRRTNTASRTYLSEDPRQAPRGTLPLGRVSPSKSPGLFSVTQ